MKEYADVFYSYNPLYYVSNTSHSLCHCLRRMDDAIVWLNGDVVFDGEIIRRLLSDGSDDLWESVPTKKAGAIFTQKDTNKVLAREKELRYTVFRTWRGVRAGLRSTIGNRVYVNSVPGVRISPSPPYFKWGHMGTCDPISVLFPLFEGDPGAP